MLQTLDLLGFLTLGLVGGFGHCIGMCAPFVVYVGGRFAPPDEASPLRRLAPQVAYGLGRTLTYGILGAVVGLLGSAVDSAGRLLGFQQAAAIVAGGALIVYGLVSLFDLARLIPSSQSGGVMARLLGFLKRHQPRHPFVTGLFLGLLPCGLLYGAFIAAAATGSPVRGGLGLVLFGLGTLPAMLALALFTDLLLRWRSVVNKLASLFVLGMGVYFVWQGLTL